MDHSSARDAGTRPTGDSAEDEYMVEALRRRSRGAFLNLVDRHHAAMVRLAMLCGRDQAAADHVAERTWGDVLEQIREFQGGSSLRVWIFRLLMQRLGETVPNAAEIKAEIANERPAVPPSRFLGPRTRWPGHWAQFPAAWGDPGDGSPHTQATLDLIQRVVEGLLPVCRRVVMLHDIEGWPRDDVADLLGLRPEEERRLLHQARSAVRRELLRHQGRWLR